MTNFLTSWNFQFECAMCVENQEAKRNFITVAFQNKAEDLKPSISYSQSCAIKQEVKQDDHDSASRSNFRSCSLTVL